MGSVTVAGLAASEPSGQRMLGPGTIVGTATTGETLAAALATGDNSFTIPALATGVVIVPPVNASIAMTVRYNTNSADAGLPLSPTNWSVLTFPLALPTTLIIHAQAAQSVPLTLWFW